MTAREAADMEIAVMVSAGWAMTVMACMVAAEEWVVLVAREAAAQGPHASHAMRRPMVVRALHLLLRPVRWNDPPPCSVAAVAAHSHGQ